MGGDTEHAHIDEFADHRKTVEEVALRAKECQVWHALTCQKRVKRRGIALIVQLSEYSRAFRLSHDDIEVVIGMLNGNIRSAHRGRVVRVGREITVQFKATEKSSEKFGESPNCSALPYTCPFNAGVRPLAAKPFPAKT